MTAICKNCAHYKKAWLFNPLAMCRLPVAEAYTDEALVSGPIPEHLSCLRQRSVSFKYYPERCGKEGRFFKAKAARP